ncbi:MAG: B12-binding domain-containing radical SAM protein [Chromatiales bacterium]|nr:MAG: B12-binding domain-containing radical SAM protein [Chromatiales bacterium]
MKITFVRPNFYPARSYDAMEPLCFAILKSLTPPDIETVLYDERLESLPVDEPTDLVAMTVETYTARRAYQVASQYRQHGIPVVMGGYHPTFMPDEASMFADAVVLGDAEGVWEQVVRDARAGRLRPRYGPYFQPTLEGLKPDRSIFAGKRYSPLALVQYGRGCRFNCEFCSIHAFYGTNLRQRPVRDVVAEIERQNKRHVFLVDDNIFVDVDRAKELFTALIPLNIRWSCQVSIDIARYPEIVELMAKSGCLSVLVGFESLDPANLQQMRKGWNSKWIDYPTAIRRFRDAGIMIYGTFVFGYDQDGPDAFEPAVEFSIEHKFLLANFNPLTPTPKADLYERLKREGRLIYDKWWLDSRFRYGEATFHPRGMTAQELTKGCYRARTAFNTASSIVRRLLDPHANLRTPYRAGIYLLSNLVSRHEIHAKQGRQLGAPTLGRPAVST